MLLVHEKMGRPGKWEVAWTWLPYFLSSDRSLIDKVDKEMTKELRRALKLELNEEELTRRMHERVLDIIVREYSIPGLRQYLGGIEGVGP